MSAALVSASTSDDGPASDIQGHCEPDVFRNGRSHLDPSQNTSGYSEISFNSVLTDDSDRLASAPLTASASAQTSTYPQGNSLASPEADRDADLKRGWKVVASASTEQLEGMNGTAGPSYSKPVIEDPLSAHLNGNAAYKETSADSEFTSNSTSLGTIDERTAAGSSSFDRRIPASDRGSFGKRMSSRFKDRVRLDSSDLEPHLYGHNVAETYPPSNEEDAEAKRVQQNLERWAAEERMKRKAARLSRGGSTLGPPAAGNRLTRRLSSLRFSSKASAAGLGAGPSEHLAGSAGASPVVAQSPVLSRNGNLSRRESTSSLPFLRNGSRPSSFSMDSGNTQDDTIARYNGVDSAGGSKLGGCVSSLGGQRSIDTNALEDVSETESEQYSGKGKQPMTNPFRDPSDYSAGAYGSTTSPRRHEKPRPTATRPIITVGRASSIQRRTIEAGMGDRGNGKKRGMPSIIATDTEAEDNSSRTEGRDRAHLNPFTSEKDHNGDRSQGGSASNNAGASTTLHHGGLDDEVAMELRRSAGRNGQRNEADVEGDLGEGALSMKISQHPSRTSTSSSKFRELGITDGDDWIESMKQTSNGQYGTGFSRRHGDQDLDRAPKRSWWTEWLCGCVRVDDDEEQAGRTNPME